MAILKRQITVNASPDTIWEKLIEDPEPLDRLAHSLRGFEERAAQAYVRDISQMSCCVE